MWIDIDGDKISYQVYGDGENLICIHGWLENKSFFRYSSYRRFLENYKVYSIDLPGFGNSSMIEDVSIEKVAKIINSFSEKLNLKKINILGQCMGTVFALDYIIRYPEKVKSIILIEPVLFFPWWFKIFLLPKVNKCILKGFLKYKLLTKIINRHKPIKGFFRDKKRIKNIKKARVENALRYVKLLYGVSKENYYNRLKTIKVPVKVVTGENTFKEVKESTKILKNVINEVEHVEYSKKNHFIFNN